MTAELHLHPTSSPLLHNDGLIRGQRGFGVPSGTSGLVDFGDLASVSEESARLRRRKTYGLEEGSRLHEGAGVRL